MRRFRDIIESPFPVPTNALWLKGSDLKGFINGKWTTIGGTGGGINPDVNSNILEVDLTEGQFLNILGGNTVVINVEEANTSYDVIKLKVVNHSYFLSRTIQANGTARYITETITVEDETSVINQIQAVVSQGVVSFSTKFVRIPEIIKLKIGNTDSVKAYNLEQLKNGFFFTQLDYGYGVGTWQSSTGGFAHVTTAYGNEVFYTINIDGSIVQDGDYIKPNEPYTVQIKAEVIGTPLDNVTASHMMSCGEIIVVGSTGPITYTRTVDSTSAAYYFVSTKKDGTIQVLTYTVANKTITASVA